MAMTTSSSINVKARRCGLAPAREFLERCIV
jgi:hypothetical protein